MALIGPLRPRIYWNEYLNLIVNLNRLIMNAKSLLLIFISTFCLSATSCVVTRHEHHPKPPHEVPPGHKKKKKPHKKKDAKWDDPKHHDPKHHDPKKP